MTKPDTRPNSGNSSFDTAEFFKEWSPLFAISGVFAGLAIYISKIPVPDEGSIELISKAGFVSSFLISLLVLYMIYGKMAEQAGSFHQLLHEHTYLDNLSLFLFTSLTLVLVTSLSNLLLIQQDVFFMILLLVFTFVVVAFTLRFLGFLSDTIPSNPIVRIPILFLICLVLSFASRYTQYQLTQEFTLTTLQNLSFSEPVPIIIDLAIIANSVIVSFASIGVLASVVSIPVVILDWVRGTGYYN